MLGARLVEQNPALLKRFKSRGKGFALCLGQPRSLGTPSFAVVDRRCQGVPGLDFHELDSVGGFGRLHMRLRCDGADGPCFADGHDVFGALLLEDALDALDGETLVVEKVADTLEQLNVIGAIIAPTTATLEWLDLREPRFPETQHMLR